MTSLRRLMASLLNLAMLTSRPHNSVNNTVYLNNLLHTMVQRMDVSIETFADSNGELSEVRA